MKTIKFLVLVTVALLVLTLVGCEHTHEYTWIFGENTKTAFEICKGCLHIRDMDKEYEAPLKVTEHVSDMEAYPTPMPYSIELDSASYDYGEEFDVTLNLNVSADWQGYYLNDELCVKIAESYYYDVIGNDEYVVEDFSFDKVRELGKLSFTFTIKATEPCELIENVKLMISLPLKDDFWTNDDVKSDFEWECIKGEKYCYRIYSLCFMTDSQGIILGSHSDKEGVFYDSINREYLSGALSKDDYIDRKVTFTYRDAVFIDEEENSFTYVSKNLRAKITIPGEYDRLRPLLSGRKEESLLQLAHRLLEILYENDVISKEEYDREIIYISEHGFCERPIYVGFDFPVDRYMDDNFWVYHYTEDVQE